MEYLDTISTNENLKPSFAVIGHRGDTYKDVLLTYHLIKNNKLTSGESLTRTTAINIFKTLKGDLETFSFKGLIPNNVVFLNTKTELHLMWVSNPKVKKLYFSESTGIKSGMYPIPRLLFKLIGNKLSVFALLKKEKVSDDTITFFAPFLNVNSAGSVCMGDTSMNYEQFDYYEDIIQFIENQFFTSVFNATHHHNLIKGNIVKVLNSMENKTVFNEDLLVTSKLTIKDIYEKY